MKVETVSVSNDTLDIPLLCEFVFLQQLRGQLQMGKWREAEGKKKRKTVGGKKRGVGGGGGGGGAKSSSIRSSLSVFHQGKLLPAAV